MNEKFKPIGIMLAAIALSVFVVGMTALCADTNQPSPTTPQSDPSQKISTTSQPQAGSNSSEIERVQLAQEIKTTKEFDDKIFSTVFWALGGTFVMFGFVNLINWYSNVRNYNREKESLFREVGEQIRSEGVKLGETIKSKTTKMDEKYGSMLTDIKDAFEKRSKAESETRAAQIEKSSTAINARIDELEERFKRDLLDVSYKFSEQEAEMWMVKEVYTNALRACLEMLAISLKRGRDYFISKDLERVSRVLQASLAKNASKPDAELVKQLNMTLAKTPEGFALTVESIRKLVAKIVD